MRVEIVSLTFPSGFHVGAAGVGTEAVRPTVPADTLFSALLATWVRLGRDPRGWAEPFLASPPFLLTSAFPRVGDLLFFPKPLGFRPAGLSEKDEKGWKRVEFVSETVLKRIQDAGAEAEVWPCSDEEAEVAFLQRGALLIRPEEVLGLPKGLQRVWTEEEVPRVALDRVTSASNLFSVGRVSFAPECGLWFGVAWFDPERGCDGMPFREAFALALAELGAHGLGGDRSVGYGVFRAEVLDSGVGWPDAHPGDPLLLLSRYHPRPDELPGVLTEAWAYRLERLQGWGSSGSRGFRRRSVWFLGEGSVVRQGERFPMGDLVDLAPQGERHPGHPVWRYGLALGLRLEVARAHAR